MTSFNDYVSNASVQVQTEAKKLVADYYQKGFRGAIRKGPALSVFIAFAVGVVVGVIVMASRAAGV